MIEISEKLERAFGSLERQIKAYINIELDKPEFTDEGSVVCTGSDIAYYPARINPTSATDITISDNQKKILLETKDMALEGNTINNYRIKLNGKYTFVDRLPYFNNNISLTASGIVSNDIASNYEDFILTLTASGFKKGSSTLTIYFEENIPSTITLNEYNSKFEPITITNNTEEVLNINLGTEIDDLDGNSVIINLNFQDFNKPEQRIRIKRIEFGYMASYYTDDIMNMSITEQVKKFCEETPENECIIKLQNVDDKFNVLNPRGITNILRENSIIKPYIGAVCEDGEEEYVSMGIYYLDKWENNFDNTATLYCKNLIKLIKEMDIPVEENKQTPFTMSMLPSILSTYLTDVCKIDNNIELNGQLRAITTNMNVKLYNFLSYLQSLAVAYNDILYIDRKNTLNIKPMSTQAKRNINDYMYKEKPKVNKIDKVNTVIFIKKRFDNEIVNWQNVNYTTITYTLKETGKEVYVLRFDNATDIGDGYSRLIEDDRLLLDNENNWIHNPCEYYLVFEGRAGDTFNYNVQLHSYKINQEKIIYTNKNENENEVAIEIDNDFIYSNATREKSYSHYLDNANQYKIEFDFIGNPAFEAGDVISVETDYRRLHTFIESIEFNYDGGLSCNIKGVDTISIL